MLHSTAPAKLNLFLETPSLRDDGYHQIDTVMVAINIHDDVSVELTGDGQISVRCHWAMSDPVGSIVTAPPSTPLPSGNDNLVFKAAAAFADSFGRDPGCCIEIAKRIPAGAGLGGASSDAATVLRSLAALHDVSDFSRLHRVATSIGSDVPFFLPLIPNAPNDPNDPNDGGRMNAATRATGRGEVLQSHPVKRRLHGVLVHPGVEIVGRHRSMRRIKSACPVAIRIGCCIGSPRTPPMPIGPGEIASKRLMPTSVCTTD